MRISDWSSDVCSSDLRRHRWLAARRRQADARPDDDRKRGDARQFGHGALGQGRAPPLRIAAWRRSSLRSRSAPMSIFSRAISGGCVSRSEEHTSELQSLMRISYAVFCLNTNKQKKSINTTKKHDQNKNISSHTTLSTNHDN